MTKNKILDFIQVIKTNSDIVLESHHEKLTPMSPFMVKIQTDIVKEKLDIEVDESILKYYSQNSLQIAWTSTGNTFIYGGFKFKDFLMSLSKDSSFWKIDFSLSPDAEVPEKLKHFEKLNWFDKQAWGDDWRYGCFIREKGIFPPKIAFFDKNWYTPMAISLDEYFDAMFASCAVCGWQYFYIDYNQDIPHLKKALEDMENAVKQLPILFPNMDFTFHTDKLIELKKIKGL